MNCLKCENIAKKTRAYSDLVHQKEMKDVDYYFCSVCSFCWSAKENGIMGYLDGNHNWWEVPIGTLPVFKEESI